MLNRKQRQFAHNYVVHLAGPAAARAAGYSPSCASETAGRLLAHPEVAELVQQLHQAKLERVSIRADKVLQELSTIAFSDVRELVSADGSIIPLQDLSDSAAASIASFELRQIDGRPAVSRLKTWNKVEALSQLCKHLGLLQPDRTEHVHTVGFTQDQLESMTDAQLANVEQAYALLSSVAAELGLSSDVQATERHELGPSTRAT